MTTTTLLPEKNKGIYTSFLDEDLQLHIVKCHEKHLNEAIEQGKQHGRSNYPDNISILKDATESITSNYNALIFYSKQKFNAILQIQQGTEDKEKVEQTNKKLYIELDDTEKKLNELLKNQIEVEEPPLKTSRYLFTLGVILFLSILFGEIFYIAKSLQIIRLNLIQSSIISFSISISIGAIAHFAPKKINEWFSSLWMRIVANLVVFILVFFVFAIISYLRSKYMNIIHNQDTSFWIFTVFNFILYIGIILIDNGLIQPNFKKIKTLRIYEKQQKAINELKIKITKIDSEIKNNNDNLYEQNSKRILLISYAKSVEDQINKLYRIAVSNYKESNRLHRGDKAPICLNETPTALDLNYSNINL